MKVAYPDKKSQRNSLRFFGILCVFGETWGICEKEVTDRIRTDMKINETMLADSVKRTG